MSPRESWALAAAPVACLTRQDGALVASEPRLACATGEPCDVTDCDNAGDYGDPAEIEGLSMDEHDAAAYRDEARYWECYMDARRDAIAERKDQE